jgi:hypothetical protein
MQFPADVCTASCRTFKTRLIGCRAFVKEDRLFERKAPQHPTDSCSRVNTRFLYLFVCVSLLSPRLAQAQFVITKVADTNTAIPNGVGNFATFSAAGYGPATGQGSVAFYATGANGQKGYYSQVGGVLGRIADTNTPVPGGGSFTAFGTISWGFEGDSLYFSGGNATQSGLYVSSNGIVTRLIDPTTTTVPPGTNKFNGFLFVYPFDARVAFLGTYGASTSQRGIYLYDHGTISKLADGNADFPGSAGLSFLTSNFAEMSHDADGEVAFFATDTNAAPPIAQGILTVANGALHTIASTSTQVPGKTNLFTSFVRKADISGGKVVFVGSYSGGSGVYQANLDGSGLVKLVDTTTQIPGSGTTNFSSFQSAAIELDTIVFVGQGPGIWGAYRLQNGTLEKIVAKPETLDGKTVDSVVLGTQGLSGGRVAFQIQFSNGSVGIYSAIVDYANQTHSGGTLVPGSLLYSPVNGFSFTFNGQSGVPYRIQYNTNLTSTNWTTLTNFTYSAPITIVDSGAGSSARRVYRAVTP